MFEIMQCSCVTPKTSSHITVPFKVAAKTHKPCKSIPQTSPATSSLFPFYAMMSALLMIGAKPSTPQPNRFVPFLSSCRFPPTPFPSRSWHPSATHISGVTPTVLSYSSNFLPLQITQSLKLLPPALACTPVSQAKQRQINVNALWMGACALLPGSICVSFNVRLTQTDKRIDFQTPCPVLIATLCVFGKMWREKAQLRREPARLRAKTREAFAFGSRVTSLHRPTNSALQNHSYGHRLEELKRAIRFHVVNNKLPHSGRKKPSIDRTCSWDWDWWHHWNNPAFPRWVLIPLHYNSQSIYGFMDDIL